MLKIATLYHAQVSLIRGGIPTYLNQTKEQCTAHNCQFDNYGYYKYNKRQSIMNKSILNHPIIVYGEEKKQELIDKLNEYDIVINYLPVVKLSKDEHRDSLEDFVLNIWKDLKAVKVIQQHTAFYGPKLITNEFTDKLVEYSDVVMTRSEQHPFAQYAKSKGKQWFQLKLYYDFDQFESKEKKTQIVSFGRPIACKKLKPLEEAKTTLEKYMTVIPADGVTKHEIGLRLFAESKILFCPTLSKEDYEYADQLEYVQMEGLANDCILVLNKRQGENCYHEGVKWIDIPNFALWFDEKDLEWTWNQIIEIAQDPEATKKFALAKNKFREELKISNLIRDMQTIKCLNK